MCRCNHFKRWESKPTKKSWQTEKEFKKQQEERAYNADTSRKLANMGCQFGKSGYEDPEPGNPFK